MQAGETLSYNGSQVCLFPLDYMYVTQVSGPSEPSHCCGHPTDYAFPYNAYPIYAPCDCHLVYQDGYSAGNTRAYTSDAPVWTPNGLMYVTFSFTHDDNPPSATSFSQGDLIAHSGTAPVYADHSHIDQADIANAQLVYYGYTCAYGNPCYALQDSIDPTEIFYLSGNETIVQTLGLNFDTWSQPPTPPSPTGTSSLLKKWYTVNNISGTIRKRR